MKTYQRQSKIIVEHKKDCFMKAEKNPWSGVINGDFYGNYNANSHALRGKDHLWYRVTCNDPNCPAIKAVHSSVLQNA